MLYYNNMERSWYIVNNTELKKMTVTAIFIAIGVLLAPFVSFPFGGARVFPLQHLINVLLSVLVGWRYSTAGAFCISSIRIAMGVGTVLAYPGSMIGAALSGLLYKKTHSIGGLSSGKSSGLGFWAASLRIPLPLLSSIPKSSLCGSLSSPFCPIPVLVRPVALFCTKFCRFGNLLKN